MTRRDGSLSDTDAITQTVRDYFEGWFGGDAARISARCTPASRSARPPTSSAYTKARMRSSSKAGAEDAARPQRRRGADAGGRSTATVRIATYHERRPAATARDGGR